MWGTLFLKKKIQSGIYTSFIVTVIYNYSNNKVDNILKLEERFQDILLKMLDKNNMLHNVLKWNNLNQIINKATRTGFKTVDGIPKTTSSLIDVLITNNPKSIKTQSTSLTPLVTNHNEISATIDIAKPKYKPITKTFRTHKTYSKENLIKSIKGHIPNLMK